MYIETFLLSALLFKQSIIPIHKGGKVSHHIILSANNFFKVYQHENVLSRYDELGNDKNNIFVH